MKSMHGKTPQSGTSGDAGSDKFEAWFGQRVRCEDCRATFCLKRGEQRQCPGCGALYENDHGIILRGMA
jgi:hypothetical protein